MCQQKLGKYLLVTGIVILLIISGCASDNSAPGSEESPDQAENNLAIPDGTLDEEFTDLLLNEQAVSDAYVVVADGNVLASVVVELDVSEEEVLELVQRYSDMLIEKYPDYNLSFTAQQNGSIIIDLEM